MLEMINVSYAYKSKKEIVHVLDKVTYRFEIGEMYGIFGPSGSGKTTCLSLLAGLEKPDEGEILLDGENIQNIGGRKLRQNSISLVFQDYQLFDYMTSLENVMVAAQISLPDVPKKELIKMCRDSLVMVGLDDSQITRKVTELSGGQQQRVAIARALITDAKYILADEPTGNLDKENRRKIVATNWPIETCPSSTILPPASSVTITLIPITASSVGPKTARSFTTARFFSLLFSQAFSNCLKSSSSCANALTTRIPAMLSCTLSDRYEKASCLFT